PAMHVGNEIGPAQPQDIDVPLEGAVVIGEAGAAEVGLAQRVLLHQGGHRPVEDQDALVERFDEAPVHDVSGLPAQAGTTSKCGARLSREVISQWSTASPASASQLPSFRGARPG